MGVSPEKREDDIHPDALVRVIKTEPKDEGLEKMPGSRKHSGLPKGIAWGIAGLIVLFIGGSIASFYAFRSRVSSAVADNLTALHAGVTDLQNLDPQSAAQEFSSLQNASSVDPGTLFGALGSLFKGGGNVIGSLSSLSGQLALFSQEIGAAESSSLAFLTDGDAGPLTAELGQMRDTLGTIDAESDKLSSAASFVGGFSSLANTGDYLSLKAQIEGAKSFLDALVPWLSDPATHHVLVLFQNPSEIRPAGGFLGSYADVTIANKKIVSVDVHDVADVDAAFRENIIPPKPLQLEVARWRPADANWFFDFPTSASKTIQFFEVSGLYADTSTTFDGAIAVSPKVVSDLLSVTGPITAGNPSTTFTADNLLAQIQKIVQNGQATSATYPKQVLRDLSQGIFAKLTVSSSIATEEQGLLSMAFNWVAKKDVMVYFKNQDLENFADAYDADGAVYELPQKFNGDYLAVVDANVNGGKSDLYVSSTVSYTGVINPDGTIATHVVVVRKHNGNKSPYWWYKTTNQDYLQFFVPPGSTITNASGTVAKKITPSVNYAKSAYSTDPLVASIESTEQTLFGYPGVAWHTESGDQVFGTWSTVKAGASTQVALDYTHRLFAPPAPGVQYQFVFEKQAGTTRHYSIEIDAPLGYAFMENGGLASYLYTSDDLPGRLTVTLTLEKITQ